jgi:DNA-binding GntR family transcriptional regulator
MNKTAKAKEIRVTKPTLAAVITTQIRDRVIDGTFAPGTQMNEVDLATRFATSRGPIREAMQRLVEEGLLVSSPHRGIWVRRLGQDDLEDLYFARAAVERAAILRLIDRGTPAALLAKLEQALARMSLAIERDQWDQVSGADLHFHELIVHAVQSERLSKMYAALAGQTRLGLNQLVGTYQGRSDLLEEHTQLMRLIAARDKEGAMEALDRHFGDAVATLKAHDPLNGHDPGPAAPTEAEAPVMSPTAEAPVSSATGVRPDPLRTSDD